MRSLAFLLAAFVLGVGLSFFLLRDGEDLSEPPLTDTTDAELAANPHLLIKRGMLVVRAKAPNGSVPPGTEVGYRSRGESRLLYAGEDGTRDFADAPLGDLEVIARAPGYQEASQKRTLLAGVPTEVILQLLPEEE